MIVNPDKFTAFFKHDIMKEIFALKETKRPTREQYQLNL